MALELTCFHCSKSFYRAACEYRRSEKIKPTGKPVRVFCSQKCCKASLRGSKTVARVELRCDYCNASFERRATDQAGLVARGVIAVFCSRRCKVNAQRASLPDSVVNEYLEGASLASLGKKHGVSSHSIMGFLELKGIPRRSKTNAWTSEFCRQRNFQKIADGFSFLTSAVEDEVAETLTSLGVNFERQKLIRGEGGRYVACVDFWIEDRFALEVNGTFWHCDSRVYPNGPVHESQRRMFESYPRKMEALKSLEIEVMELWEIDFRADALGSVKKSLSYLEQEE